MNVRTLFGVPLVVEATQRDRWISTLTRDWTEQMGRRPRLLAGDLDDLAALFGTGAKPKVIRDKVHSLPSVDKTKVELPESAVIVVDGAALVTPEGRILLDVLLGLQRTGSTIIESDQQIFALDVAVKARSMWHSVWLRKQFEGSLSAPALGAALFLIVNGSIGPDRGLLFPKDVDADRELGAVVMPLIAQFSDALGGKEPDTLNGIRQHWSFTQISRLLGRAIARETLSTGTLTYVRPGQEVVLLDEIARRLERLDSDPNRRRDAVMGLVDGYRRSRGLLAALGQMHEEPTATHRLVSRLADREIGR